MYKWLRRAMVRQGNRVQSASGCAFITFQLLYEILQIRFISMHWNTFANFAAESCSNIRTHGRPTPVWKRCKMHCTVASYAALTDRLTGPTDCKDSWNAAAEQCRLSVLTANGPRDRQWLDMPKLSLLVWQFIKKHVRKFYIVFAISLIQNLFEEPNAPRASLAQFLLILTLRHTNTTNTHTHPNPARTCWQ